MIKETAKKIENNIELILIISILTLTILNVTKYMLDNYFVISINFVMIIYFLVKILRKTPIKLIKSKLDIFVIILALSPVIPLICNTYISLSATVECVMNYIVLYWIYILAREMFHKNPKNVKVILNLIIVIAIGFVIIGIENLTTNAIFSILNINYIINGEDRLVSIFGHPNVLAVFITFAYFISIDKLVNVKNSIGKVVYATANTILILGLILTYSKAMYLIFPIMLLAYMFIIKDRTKNTIIILNTVASLTIGAVYTYIFLQLVAQELYFTVLFISIIGIIIAILVNITNIKLEEKLEKIKIKTIILIMAIIVILGTTWIIIELNNGKPFVAFNGITTSTYNSKKIKNIKPNEKYIFSFDIDASCDFAGDFFTINIIQRGNKSIAGLTNKEVTFSNFSGIKNIEIETTENTSEIKIEFKVKSEKIYKNWVINSLKINGEEVILEYKHLPTKLVEKISDISLNYKTAQERFQFIKDGFKIITENPLTGIGDSGWKYKYREVQDYKYEQDYLLSYITQIWLEYGIFALIGLAGIAVILLKNKDANLGLKIAIIALLIHSSIDIDMNFMYMRILFFISLGMLLPSKKDIMHGNYKTNIFCITLSIITIILSLNPSVYDKTIIVNQLEKSKNGLYINSQEYKQIDSKLLKEYANLVKYERSESNILIYETRRAKYAIKNEENLEEILNNYYEKMIFYKEKYKNNIDKKRVIERYITEVIKALKEKNNPELYPYIVKLDLTNL